MRKLLLSLAIAISMATGALAQKIVMTTSDYQTGNTAVYDVATGTFSDNVLGHFQDAYVRTDGTYLYIIEGQDYSNIIKFDPDDLSNPIYQYSVGPGSNPHDIVFCGDKAYVARYNSTGLWVVDPNASSEDAFKIGEIDLSQWADGDGSPEAHAMWAYNGRLYVACQRYDMGSFTVGDAVLVVVDIATDTLVDMDPSSEGIQAIPLMIKNPQSGSLLGSELYLAGTTYGVSDEGIIRIDLDNPLGSQEKIIGEAEVGGNIAGVDVYSPTYGLFYAYDESWSLIARSFNPQTGEIGRPLPVPDAGGGVVACNGLLYVGSRHFENPGMYIVDPLTNTLVGDIYPTELPPYDMVAIGGTYTEVAMEGSEPGVPSSFHLEQNYPNPFNSGTTIRYSLGSRAPVQLDIYNAVGQLAVRLVSSTQDAGSYSVSWDGRDMAGRLLPSGVYFVRLQAGSQTRTMKIVMIK